MGCKVTLCSLGFRGSEFGVWGFGFRVPDRVGKALALLVLLASDVVDEEPRNVSGLVALLHGVALADVFVGAGDRVGGAAVRLLLVLDLWGLGCRVEG